MNIAQESVSRFQVGTAGADAVARPIVPAADARKAYKGITVRAGTDNTVTIYVGNRNVTVGDGYPLQKTEEVTIPVEAASLVYVIATPAANCEQTVALSGEIAGDTFTLTFDGATTTAISVTAAAAAVESALEALSTIGSGNVSVTDTAGGPPYTVEFTGTLAKTDVELMVGAGYGVNEVQNVTVTGAAAGDTIVLTYDGQSSASLAYDATSAQIEDALEVLSNVGPGNVSVEDGATGWDVEFIGDLALTDVAAITGEGGKNEVQTISLPDTVNIGTFTVTYDGQTTAAIAYNAASTAVQSALEGLSNIAPGDVEVTGGPGPTSDWLVEFTGDLANTNVNLMTTTSSCGENEIQSISVPGTTDTGTFTITYSGQTTAAIAYNADSAAVQTALENLSNIGVGEAIVTGGPGGTADYAVEFAGTLGITDVDLMTTTSSCGRNEKQTVSIDDASDGGTFTLTLDGQTTAGIAYNASATDVKTALELLSSVDTVTVTGGPGPTTDWVVEFTGTHSITDVNAMTGDGTSLTGGSTTVTITETVKGVTATVAVAETNKGVTETVVVAQTITGNEATVTVTTTQAGDTTCTVAIAKVADITTGSQYSWLSA